MIPRLLPQCALVGALVQALLLPCALAQGSAEDYARADERMGRSRGTVRDRSLRPHWTGAGRWLLFQREGAASTQWVRVDRASGEQSALDAEPALRSALGEADFELRRLEYDAGERAQLLVSVGASARLLAWEGAQARVLAAQEAALLWVRPEPASSRGRSEGGGGRAPALFHNDGDSAVRIEWVDERGRTRDYGSVAAGEDFVIESYAGHLWRTTHGEGAERAHWRVPPGGGVVLLSQREALAEAASEDEPAEAEVERAWQVGLRGGDVFLSAADGSDERRLSQGGGHHGPVRWSPDGRWAIVRHRTDVVDRRIHFVESAPEDALQPRLHELRYPKPGDARSVERPVLVDCAAGELWPLDDALFPDPWRLSNQRWSSDSRRFTFLYDERGHARRRLIALDPQTRELRSVIEEDSATFVDYSQKHYLRHLDDERIVWMSERSGWNHLYLVEPWEGGETRALTAGDWLVREVESFDEERGEFLLRVMGHLPERDPYHVHFARVGLGGEPPVFLTDGEGTHALQFAPDGAHYVATWSNVARAPVHELRRSADGALVARVLEADWSELLATDWQVPERVAYPGRDGQTPVWGVVFRPSHFDPARRYPVIEKIYAGPHGHHAPVSFRNHHGAQSLAELGFVVVQIDGMGTNWRHKAFHDVCWKNLADAGFPDRIAWMRAAAAERPWMDLERVGIFGGSAGGQNAMRALIDHHDFYRAAAADCGCHDNRMDKVWWNEAWMGYPVDEAYERSSNVVHAHRLEGALLLTVGEVDRNVDPASTMQVVDALIAADKDFELIVFPGRGHGAGDSAYGVRRRRDFFVRELWGNEPRH